MLRSENARLAGWIYVDIRGRDLASVVNDAKRAVAREVKLPPGVSVTWSGQFEYLERAKARLAVVVPFTLAIIFVLLYLTFGRFGEAALIMLTLPFALIGGFWLIWLLGHNLSVAGAIGFIALAGLAAEFGVVMLVYLRHALDRRLAAGETPTLETLLAAIDEGAVLRVRPKAMTVAVILGGLAPIMWSDGTGAEVMQRIAAPMIGGMITAPLLSMLSWARASTEIARAAGDPYRVGEFGAGAAVAAADRFRIEGRSLACAVDGSTRSVYPVAVSPPTRARLASGNRETELARQREPIRRSSAPHRTARGFERSLLPHPRLPPASSRFLQDRQVSASVRALVKSETRLEKNLATFRIVIVSLALRGEGRKDEKKEEVYFRNHVRKRLILAARASEACALSRRVP